MPFFMGHGYIHTSMMRILMSDIMIDPKNTMNIFRTHKPKSFIYLLFFFKLKCLHYLHFSDYCPHLCRHVYHDIILRTSLFTFFGLFVAMFITTFRPLYAPAFFRWLEC